MKKRLPAVPENIPACKLTVMNAGFCLCGSSGIVFSHRASNTWQYII